MFGAIVAVIHCVDRKKSSIRNTSTSTSKLVIHRRIIHNDYNKAAADRNISG